MQQLLQRPAVYAVYVSLQNQAAGLITSQYVVYDRCCYVRCRYAIKRLELTSFTFNLNTEFTTNRQKYK